MSKKETTDLTPNERSLANLKPPWGPGESGNLAGKPKGAKMGLRARLMHALEKQITPNILDHLKQEGIDLDSNENAEGLARVLINQAFFGDISAIKVIAEQTESPLPKEVNLNGELTVNIGEKDAGLL